MSQLQSLQAAAKAQQAKPKAKPDSDSDTDSEEVRQEAVIYTVVDAYTRRRNLSGDLSSWKGNLRSRGDRSKLSNAIRKNPNNSRTLHLSGSSPVRDDQWHGTLHRMPKLV